MVMVVVLIFFGLVLLILVYAGVTKLLKIWLYLSNQVDSYNKY